MRVIKAVTDRLDQSGKMAGNLGIELPSSGLSSEYQVRHAIWRCIFCRHGAECADWVNAGRPGVPDFCSNRAFYLDLARQTVQSR